jgi:hypothetical protein
MSYNFNHIPDMDHDGKHTLKDSGCFHDMMGHTSHHSNDTKTTWDIFGECIMLCFLVLAAPILVLNIVGWLGQLLR